MAREALSKKTRFDVFKRDAFCCQYCGATPPNAVLEVDHIQPVSKGGKNAIDNLVTACFDCNRGKSDRLLGIAPKTLKEKADEVSEREAQLKGYSEVMEARRQRIDDDCWRVMSVLYPGKESVRRDEFLSVQRFVERLGVHQVLDAAEVAMASAASYSKKFKYFCGVCWNRVRETEQ